MSEFRRNRTWAKALFVPIVILTFPILVATLWFVEEVEASYQWLNENFPGGAIVGLAVFAAVFLGVWLYSSSTTRANGQGERQG
ncbi:MAG: hypothetical protein QNJ15_04465 [Erythrobacter sp.]|nr:hypothetical protein [Erythrobacter sp.]